MSFSSAFERLFHSLIVLPIKNFVVIFSLIIPQFYFVLILIPYYNPSGPVHSVAFISHLFTICRIQKALYSNRGEHKGDSSISEHPF